MGHGQAIGYARRLALACTVVVAMLASSAAARAEDIWRVTEASGDAAQQSGGGQWIALKAGDSVGAGASVRTGADGRLMLSRASHQDTVTVSPGSQFSLPAGGDSEIGPTILQSLGTLLFKVEHTPGRHFEVKGPYLTAVVKGTVFTVSIGQDENLVSLAKGSVEVTDSKTREVALLRPGQTARVSPTAGRPIQVIGALAPGAAQPPRTEPLAGGGEKKITETLGDVHLDVAALSNNLVRDGGNSRVSSGASDNARAQTGDRSNAGGSAASEAAGAVDGALGGTAGVAASASGGAASAAGAGSSKFTVGSIVSAAATSLGGAASAGGANTGSIVSATAQAANSALKGAKSKGKAP